MAPLERQSGYTSHRMDLAHDEHVREEEEYEPGKYGLSNVQAAMREPFRGVCQALNSVRGEDRHQEMVHGEVAGSGRLAIEYLRAEAPFSWRLV